MITTAVQLKNVLTYKSNRFREQSTIMIVTKKREKIDQIRKTEIRVYRMESSKVYIIAERAPFRENDGKIKTLYCV